MSLALQLLPWLLVLVLGGLLAAAYRQQRRARAAQQVAATALAQTNATLTRIRQAVESASDAIGIGDMEGTSLYHNRAHIALFGYSVEELNAVPDGGVLFADKVVAAAIHAAIRGGYSWAGETDVRTKDGRSVPCFVRADIIRDERGEPAGIFGVFSDITERRRTERLVEEQRRRLEVTLQSIGDAVITTDAAGLIVLMNPIAEQFTGSSAAHATGRPVAEILRPLDERSRQPRESGVAELLREPRRGRSADAYVLVGPTGAERFIAENAALIKTADGSVAGAVLALRDVTRERKRADEQARAGKLESLGLMAGSIAHDFGNLLTAMVANLSLAQLTPGLPAEAKDRLADTERAVWRARDVTQQLTTFAKGGTLKKKVVALGPLLKEAAGFAVQNTSVQARYQIAPDLWPVEADDSQLVQVINNLALNAVQAMPGGGLLLLAAENQAPDDDSNSPARGDRWIKLAITDTGTGIAPENLAKIFEPFFTTKAKGSGFGLATSYSIIKKHGGQLRVESALGQGTTFHILLPAAPTAAGGASAAPFAAPAARRGKGRVLIADEDAAVRESVTLMLGLLDYEADAATSLDAALEKLSVAQQRNQAFDAVLLAVAPDAAPATVARARQLAPDTVVLVVTTDAEHPQINECGRQGAATILTKPLKMDAVGSALQTVLTAR